MKAWILAGGVNLAVLYALGMAYFYFIADVYLGKPIGLGALVYSCCLIFLPGDLLKCFLGAVAAERLRLMLPEKILNGAS